ncbi:MAG: DUF2800 domain-containing protein [Endomicrobium sp.]|jgi:hypothetical protein|uniref:DUF2800 domain-containing protein n=1 Tax=Candidatus Endomicrobiellum cubanum TaxID=3242325 RepID=UPI00283990D9|nr:DUF2800 domain-containing protein [Endomicrobium sp.]
MQFKQHTNLDNQHAFLSPSKYHWVNYDIEKLDLVFGKWQSQIRGIRLHEFACTAIRLGIKLPNTKQTLNQYVNDAIGFRMKTEQVLYYSENCFGTADAIDFRKDLLRIHDLKTGNTTASITQLEIYAALFCLEYHYKPKDIKTELRLYQSNNIIVNNYEIDPELPETIETVMEKIILFDKRIDEIKCEEL